MSHPALERILSFCLDRLETEPLATRLQIYRDLGAIFPHEDTSKTLTALADQIEQAHKIQLTLNFKPRR